MKITTKAACATFAVLLFGLVGCSAVETDAGFGLPTLGLRQMQSVAAAGGSTAQLRTGTLTVEPNGCFTFEDSERPEGRRTWIVWPDTARQEGDEVILSSGAHLGQGDALSASAAQLDLADLPNASDRSSYFGSFGRFCDADVSGVVVLADVAP